MAEKELNVLSFDPKSTATVVLGEQGSSLLFLYGWDSAMYRTKLAKGLGSSSWLTAGAAFSYTAKGAYYDTDRPMRLLVRNIDGYFVLFNLINVYSYSIDMYTI